MNPRNGWSQSPGWGPAHQTGWAPLVDHGPLPLQTARSVGRWLWCTLAVAGFLLVTAFTLTHDDPTPGRSLRGLLTIALAATVVVLLTIRRAAGPGPLTRAVCAYVVVFVRATLVATTGLPPDHPTTTSGGPQISAAHDPRPALVKTIDSFRDWLGEWRTWAHKENDRRTRSSAATPAPALSPTTRRSL